MLYKHKIKFIPVLTMVALIATTLSVNVSKAAATSAIDLMSNQNTSVTSNHVVKFIAVTAVGAPEAGLTYTFTYQAGFTTVSSITDSDVTFTHGPSTGAETSETVAASASATDWGFGVSGQVITLTSPTDGIGAGAISANDTLIVTIGGANKVTNPSSTGNYTVVLGGTVGDTATATVPIIAPASVTITATVEPTITFSVRNSADSADTSTCSLGVLTTVGVSTCTYKLKHATNATTGIVISVIADGALRNAAHSITNPTGAVNTGEEYGFVVNSTPVTDETVSGSYATPDQIVPVISTTIITNVNPHVNTLDTVVHSASISAVTPAGSYTQVVTWTAVGQF